MGYMQMIAAIQSKLDRGVMTKDGQESKITETERRDAAKAIGVLREQAGAAMGRQPKFEADARDDAFDGIAPYAQTAVSLLTTPNWTSAAFFTEGPAGVAKRVRDIMSGATNKFGGFSYFKNKAQMRDDLHAYGLALPYHMTQLGFGHIWHLGEDASAAMDIDPSMQLSGHDKLNKGLGRVAGAGFERVNLAQRHVMIEPSQDIMRRILVTDADGMSKARKLLGLIEGSDKKIDRKVLAKFAKQAGVKRDVAWLLYQQGAFQSEARIQTLEDLSAKYNVAGDVLKVEDMYGDIQSKLDKISTDKLHSVDSRIRERELAEEQAMASALQSVIHHLITQTNMEPEAGARNINNSAFGRLWGALTSYALQFSRNTLAQSAGLGGMGLLSMIAPLFMGEMVWYSLSRMKKGDKIEDIQKDLTTDLPGYALKALARMPFFGAGSFVSDTIMSQMMGLVSKATDGAAFSSMANERSYGMTLPGMPGVSMMLQFLSQSGDFLGRMADYESSAADKASSAAEFLSEIVPLDFRPVMLAAGNQVKAESSDQGTKTVGDRTGGGRDTAGTGFTPPRPPGGDRRPGFEKFADTYAEDMANARIPLSRPPQGANPAQGAVTPPSANQPPATPQAAPAGLSAPKGNATSGPYGPGSASSGLADRK